MDELKRLKLEYDGIYSLIKSYTNGSVLNHVIKLEKALDDNDIEVINYCLNEISIWYLYNIDSIRNNELCYNKMDHYNNQTVINTFVRSMATYELGENYQKDENQVAHKPKIFLSHSSDDKKYGDALQKLITGLGIDNSQLIYTSHPLHKIPLDNNIYEYLRSVINDNVFMIFLWSNTYIKKPACLNEMGAAWLVCSDYTNIYTPDFNFRNSKYHDCAVDTNKIGIKLDASINCKAGIQELKNKILKMFNLTINDDSWMCLLDDFINDVK
ncbi:MAG: toll/interleukin-1 receptor domain-containing protein [Candidatus Cloacimonetes bacterium]|nr:toll/interleukin-1 receptor domain-containing protein [Candidatus Cloacimonadota bacterium]